MEVQDQHTCPHQQTDCDNNSDSERREFIQKNKDEAYKNEVSSGTSKSVVPHEMEEPLKRVIFDDILVELGEFGLEQKINYVLFSLPYILTSMQLMGWVFVGFTPTHRCRVPGDPDQSMLDHNMSYLAHSFNDSRWEVESCTRKDLETNLTESCLDGHIYLESGNSVTRDWSLVCEREGMKATVGAAPMAGYLVGGLLFGTLTDRFGRKPTFFFANMLMAGGGILAALSPEFVSFVAARTLTGFSIAGIEAACFVMGMELVGPNKRTLAGILCWFFETTGLLCCVTLAYLIQDSWRVLQFVYSAPALIFLAYWWIAPESIRWLVARGRNIEARKLINRACKRNKVELSEDLIYGMEQTIKLESYEDDAQKTYTIIDLFRYPSLRWKTLILWLCWVTCASLYYVLLLDQSELSEDKYVGFFLTSLVQLPGYFYVIVTLEWPAFGRKNSMSMFLILAGLALFTHPLIPATYAKTKFSVSLIGRFAANCSYTILNLFSAEQFPTVVRGVGMGMCVVVSRIGTMLAPYLLLLGQYSPCLFGMSALISGLAALLLPETLGQAMPETLQDGENLPLSLPCASSAMSSLVNSDSRQSNLRQSVSRHSQLKQSDSGHSEIKQSELGNCDVGHSELKESVSSKSVQKSPRNDISLEVQHECRRSGKEDENEANSDADTRSENGLLVCTGLNGNPSAEAHQSRN